MKIGTKIILIITILISISIVINGTISYVASKQIIEKEINAHLESAVTLKENFFFSFLKERKGYIEEIANEKEFLATFLKQDIKNINILLQERLLHQDGVFEFFVLDLNGKVFTSTYPQQEGRFRNNEAYFINGQKITYFQNIYYDILTNKTASIISTPIKNAKGETIGVLAGKLNLGTISELMAERSGLGETGETYLVSKYNTILSKIYLNNEIGFTKAIYTDGIKDCLAGNNGKHYINYDGVPVIGTHKWILDNEVCLVAEIKQSEAYGPIDYLRFIFIFVGFGLVIITTIIGKLFASSLTKPILELRKDVGQIASGNLNIKTSIITKDEVGQLAIDINQMTKDLKKQGEEIAQRNKNLREKAKELAEKKEVILSILEDTEKEKEITTQEKNKNEAILASIGDAVMACDKNGQVMLFNNVAEKLTGFSMLEVVGHHYSKAINFINEDDGKPSNDFISEAMTTNKKTEITGHSLLVTKDGRKIPVADSAAPIKNTKGDTVGCVMVFRDITHEREIDKIKTEFVSLASHQLRTPLSSINWYTEMLLAGDVGKISEEQKKYLDEIYNGNQRMVDLVNALLNISRLELGTFMVEPEPINTAELARNVVAEQQQQIKIKEINLSQKYENTLPLLNADPKLLRMIFQNLLSNAIKYTSEKGEVKIKIELSDANGNVLSTNHQPLITNLPYILIKVSDNGYGIPKNQQEKIFTKLFRVDNVREKDTEGTGLGLYIVKAIVNHSGGKIWFESEENKGTTFYVTLPLDGMKVKFGTKILY
ncbi:MAG: hypothetical protein C0412_12565 [Flavobacterium sp.]|nr:hypothetical protein [Flavobacterium sp.]